MKTMQNAHKNTHVAHAEHQDHNNKQDIRLHTSWDFKQEPLISGRAEPLTISIHDERHQPLERFRISHEKLMHLIIVKKDLSFFDHLHPDFKGSGKFTTNVQFPSAGEYKLIAEFLPEGGVSTVETQWVCVNGEPVPEAELLPDNSLTRIENGLEITLSIDTLRSQAHAQLTFTFRDSTTKKPVIDLQPYLGAVGHVVVMSANASEYLHNHPLDEKVTGPVAIFGTSFPSSGIYKLWGQFKRNNKLVTVSFTIEVP